MDFWNKERFWEVKPININHSYIIVFDLAMDIYCRQRWEQIDSDSFITL